MKNAFRLIGIAALVAAIGFSVAGCSDGNDDKGPVPYSVTITPGADFKPAGDDGYFRIGPAQDRTFVLTVEPEGEWDVTWSSSSDPAFTAMINPTTGRLTAGAWSLVDPTGDGVGYDGTLINITARVSGPGGYMDGKITIKLCFA